MKIVPSENIKKQFVKRFWKETRRMFIKVRQEVADQAEHTDGERLKDMVQGMLNDKVVKDQLISIWSEVGGKYANDTERTLKFQKSGKPEMELKEDRRKYWNERSIEILNRSVTKKVTAILDTETEAINRVIDQVIEQISTEGLGIAQGRKLLRESLQGETMTTIENWQAQRIAMTEVGMAANSGSFAAAQENSEGVKKEWMFIPGLKTFRENHQQFESLGPVEMDYAFMDGLQYPGDPEGAAEEVINCYCSIVYDVGN
jgi:hypothetical protein